MHKVQALIGTMVVCLAVMSCLVHGASFNFIDSTFAGGNGEFVDPQKIARLSNGDLIVSDAKGHSIKKISNGVVTTIAGTGVGGFSGDNANATAAQLNSPFGIAILNDEIYFADRDNNRIRKIDLNGNISTIAGTGTAGFSGDNDLAVNSKLSKPMDVAFNAAGELLIADMNNYRIRKIMTNGTIVTIIGSGASGYTGDNGLAINAALSQAYGVRISSNNIYISDTHNFKIRKVVDGNISTIAGSGSATFNGDNILATSANLNNPSDVAFLSTGEMLIADTDNYRVRMVLTNGTIITIAGNGTASFSESEIASSSAFSTVTSVLVVSDDEIYIADAGNARIRMLSINKCFGVDATSPSSCSGNGDCTAVDTCVCKQGWSGSNCNITTCSGIMSTSNTVCNGKGTCSAFDNCICQQQGWSGSNCNITSCYGVASNDGTVCGGHGTCSAIDTCICQSNWFGSACNITTCSGIMSTSNTACNGKGTCSAFDNCVCQQGWSGYNCNITSCYGVASNDGTVCGGHGTCNNLDICVCSNSWTGSNCNVSSGSNSNPATTYTYTISTFVGGNGEFVDPQKIARLSNGDLIVSDAKGHSIKKISKSTRSVTTIAGTGVGGFSGDNLIATAAKLQSPFGIAILNDEIYFADRDNNRIRKIDLNGNISTIAGTGTAGFSGDNDLAVNSKLSKPMDVAFNAAGELLIADMNNYRIRKIMTNGTIVTIIGSGASGYTGDNGLAINAALSQAYGVRISSNNIYISDANNFKVRKVDSNQIITTIAGSGSATFNGDSLLATVANLNHPTDVAFLSTGEMLIADTDNYRVRMVLTNKTMVTVAGNGTASLSDGRIASSQGLSTVTGILVVSDDEIYIADAGNARIRLLSTKSHTCNGIDFTDSSVCSGHGVCSSVDTCTCKKGWKGQYCNVVDEVTCFGVYASSSEVCGGHGSCSSLDTCICNNGYYGSTCTMQLQQCVNETLGVNTPCFGNGNCTNSGCVCNNGFYGKHCTFGFNVFASPITHTILGIEMASQLEIFLEYIDSIEYLWSQTSGPTISNLESLVGRLNGPTLHIPSKLEKISLNNGLVPGQNYGFSLSAKITTKTQVFTATSSVRIAVLTDPKLTFLLQDASTNQNITSGIAGTTQFKAIITSNSNQDSDSALQYGFGFSDGNSITILTALSSETSATFKLPFIAGQSSVDLYVACFGSNTRSVQKLTTIYMTNPVSNLTPTQAVSAISNLISANSSATDLLGAASLLNTISTNTNSDVSAKTNIRSTIISSLSNIIATAELGPALKALSSVTTTTSEITEASANTAFTALLGATSNPTFSKNDLQSIINIASNVFTSSSDSASDKFSNTIAATLSKAISSGDIVSASSSNLEMAVAKALQAFTVGLNSFKFTSSGLKRQGIVEVIVCSGIMYNGVCLNVIQIQVSSNKRPARQPTKKTRMASSEDYYTVGSKTYDIKGILENGTTIHDGVIHGYLEITIPYTPSGNSIPVCGLLYDSVGEMVLDSSIITTVNSGSVTCKTKIAQGNALLLKTTISTPKNSTQISGSETLSKSTMYLAMVFCVILLLL